MYENVLVPVDLSMNSRYTLRCLRHIPVLREVKILHVVYNRYPSDAADLDDPDREYQQRCLEKIKKGADVPDVMVRTMVEEIAGGEIFEVVNRIAAQEKISLTLMGRRGRGIIDTLLLGSVASDVLRYGKTDLLLVDNKGAQDLPCPDLFSHALICTDFSDPEIVSLCSNELPWIRNVTLFHAVETGDSTEKVRSLVDSAHEELERMRDALTPASISARIQVSVGSAAEEIISFAKEQDISIIIMKSTGKRDFMVNLLGSTTARVTRNTQKPVLVMRRSMGDTQ